MFSTIIAAACLLLAAFILRNGIQIHIHPPTPPSAAPTQEVDLAAQLAEIQQEQMFDAARKIQELFLSDDDDEEELD